MEEESRSWSAGSASESGSLDESSDRGYVEEEFAKLEACEAEDEDEIGCVFAHVYEYLDAQAWEEGALAACNKCLEELFAQCAKDKLYAINQAFLACVARTKPVDELTLLEVYAPYLRQIVLAGCSLYALRPVYRQVRNICKDPTQRSREELRSRLRQIIPRNALREFGTLMSNMSATPQKGPSLCSPRPLIGEFGSCPAKDFSSEKFSSAFKRSGKASTAKKENYTLVAESQPACDDHLFANICLDLLPDAVSKALF